MTPDPPPESRGPDSGQGPAIPDYELIRLVGRGSYGDVWLARGLTGTYRAVKVVWRDRFIDLEPFHREFEGLRGFAAVSLTDPSQLAMLHVGRNDAAGFFYYVMELADDAATGREVDPERYVPLTLKEMRSRKGRLPVSECVSLGIVLAGGLNHLHERGLVHRDVKPSNVIVVDGKPKLADIGLVAPTSDANSFVGTEGFVPQEGPGTPAADVYSLGKLLYEISTGMDRHEFPRLPPGLDQLPDRKALLEFNEVLLRACAPSVADRYTDAAQVRRDLMRLEAGGSVRLRRNVVQLGRIAAMVLAVVAVGGGLWWVARHEAEKRIEASSPATLAENSIAVLPFTSSSPNPNNAYFADGMNEEVTAQLAKIRDLNVVSRAATLAYKSSPRDLHKIGTELGVAHLLEGTVWRSGDKVRIDVRMTDARTGAIVRKASFERDLNAVFSIRSALAQDIAGALHADVTADERASLGKWPTQDLAAYDDYLQARALGNDSFFEPEPLGQAVNLYEQAVAKDPSFALAYAHLAIVHAAFYQYGHLDATPARLTRMKAAADAAVRLDPGLPEGRMALGIYDLYGLNDPKKALAEYRLAQIGLPNDDRLLVLIGGAELWSGDWAGASANMDRASVLNPQDATIATTRSLLSMFLRRYHVANRVATEGSARFPDSRLLPRLQARAQYEIDRDRTAFLHRWASMPLLPEDPHGLAAGFDLAMFYGDYGLASHILDDSRMPVTFTAGHAVPEPVALKRAMVSFLRGQRESAITAANDALSFYKDRKWSSVQLPAVDMQMALAEAFAGSADAAILLGREGLLLAQGHNALVEADVRPCLGMVYAILGKSDEALMVLKNMMSGPSRQTAEELRHDPIWVRLSGDPRFESILRSAKIL